MAGVAVTSLSPVRVDTADSPTDRLSVLFLSANRSTGTIYYGSSSAVSASSNDGSLTPGQSVTLDRAAKWFIAATDSSGGPASGQIAVSSPDPFETAFPNSVNRNTLVRVGAGAVEVSTDHGTTWGDPGGPVFNVKNPAFAGGAKGDGTTDDTAAIQAAITAAAGADLVFPPAAYNVASSVTGLSSVKRITTVGATFTGAGASSITSDAGVPQATRRLKLSRTGSRYEWGDPDRVDLRDYDTIRDGVWQTTLGATLTSGSPLLTNTVQAFTSRDVGKSIIVKLDGGTRFYTTILSVNSSGVATLAANAPGNATNQRVSWGSDVTTALNSALQDFKGLNANPKQLRLVGWYRASQIVIPPHIDLDGLGWGSYGPSSSSNGPGGWNGTLLQQLPGAQKNFVVFEPDSDDGTTKWIGPVAIRNLAIAGPEADTGTTVSIGSGIALRDSLGNVATAEDGFFLDDVHISFFPQDGLEVPGGGLPLAVRRLRCFYNAGYGVNYTDDNGSHTHTQGVHFLDLTGDGNSLGLIRFKDCTDNGHITLTNVKSEKGNIYTPPGAPATYQENAVIFEDCDNTPVTIDGITHISSKRDGAGAIGSEAPGPAILVKSATDKRPTIRFNAVVARLIGVETANTANAVTLRDQVISVDVPVAQNHGEWPPRIDALDALANQTGEAVMDRDKARDATTLSNQTLRLAFFTARKTETKTQVRVQCVTAAGATPTLIRFGLYTVAANGDITLVASTANDTTLLAGAGGETTKALSSSYKVYAGRRYAFGALVVTAAAAPAITSLNAQSAASTEMGRAPRLSGAVTGQADLPASVASGSITNSGNMPFGVLLP